MIIKNIAALIVGIITKLYDDLTDSDELKISENTFFIELLKVLQVSTVTIWFYNDHFNAVLATMALLSAFFVGEIDTNFWLACTAVPFLFSSFLIPFLLFFVDFKTIMNHLNYKFIHDSLHGIIIVSSNVYLEKKYYPEDSSEKKYKWRFLIMLWYIIIVTFFKDMDLIINFIPIMYFNIGYLAMSVFFQTFLGKYLKNIITYYNKGKKNEENNQNKQADIDNIIQQ